MRQSGLSSFNPEVVETSIDEHQQNVVGAQARTGETWFLDDYLEYLKPFFTYDSSFE